MNPALAAQLFTALSLIVILFQICLAAGLPWGAASMGGKFPGKYPPKMRVVAVVNALLLSFIALIVCVQADLLLPGMKGFAGYAIWGVVLFCFAGTVLNTITPSKIERIWAPVCLIQFGLGLYLALG